MAEGGEDRNSGDPVLPSSLLAGESKSASLAVGENVNQRIINSSVNVVAGDQITVNKITNNYTMNSGIEAIPTDQQKASALIKCINDNAYQKTADKILEDIGADDLSKPDFQVHPQMRRVTKSEYFKGNYEEVQEMEVTVKKKLFFWKKKEVVKNQFRKEFGFLRQKVDNNKFIELDEVLQEVINGQSSITAIVASAGSGKTTLMRRIARITLVNSLTNTDAIVSPSKLKYKLISFIEIKEMQDEGSMKPSKFLFGGLFQDEIDEEHAFQWLLKHQSEAVLFFDGLDQATWKINRDGDKNINPYTPAEAATIMYNILSRNLLADTKIVFSSREFQVSDLPAEARPADIITLCGMTLEDAKKLFVFLIHQHGDEAWEKIETMSPRLINLVSIPVFLVLTAVIMAKNPNEPPPKTVTGLYQKIVSTLSSVKNIRKADAIGGVINKLKAMAYRGMKEGRVTFSENDLKKFGLSKEEVQDLMMKVPGNNLLSCNLLDGSFIFFFCHQSLQEFLAAGFVVEMTRTKFSSFKSKHLHKERWSVVRTFVCGIIYDETTDNIHEVSNRSLKKQILGESIRSQLKKKDEHAHMELYTAIYESGDGDLMRQISDIDASDISLSRDEAHIVGSLAVRSESMKSLNLNNCNINDELLTIITGSLEKRIQVKEVDLSYNKLSATALRSLLGHRRIESLSGKLDWEVVKLNVDRWDVELMNEEDVIKISGRKVGGHFDFKDSTLSFKMVVSVAAVKYVSDLFDAKFIKLIEELSVQEDGLRELSEYRIEKVKELDLRNNEVPATSLRSFLGHRRIESLSGKLDWEVVKLTVDGGDVELTNEVDLIKMSGRWIEGHFDFKDTTLSFKMVVSVTAVKYVSDLFVAKFIELIEMLLVQEDGLRELSEYRIEKVKEVNLREDEVPATALRSFLGHRRIESLAGKLDWEVVKLTVDGWRVELKNEEDVIKISGGNITGHFNIKDSTLSFKKVQSLAAVKFFINLFDAELIEELCVKQAGLRELLEWKVKKISKIVLNCTEEESIDWSLIETCWKKYQWDLQDIAVNGQIPVDDYKLILERGRAISVPLHIHAMFYVEKADEFRKTLEACQQKKIEYIRCIFFRGYHPSLDEISSLVNNSNLKKVSLLYDEEDDMLKGDELKKVQKIANDLDTELEVLRVDLETDAWMRLDWDFYGWEERRRWQMRNR